MYPLASNKVATLVVYYIQDVLSTFRMFLFWKSLIQKTEEKFFMILNKITEVKDGDVASVPPKGGMGSLITITSAIDESIPKSNDDVNKKFSKDIGYIKSFSQCDKVVESLDKYLSKKYDVHLNLTEPRLSMFALNKAVVWEVMPHSILTFQLMKRKA